MANYCAATVAGARRAPNYQERCFFLWTLQNEVTPNHAKVIAKAAVAANRPKPACPAWYLLYSFTLALVMLSANTRKRTPTISSQSWCSTLPKERAVARVARAKALNVRLRPACWPATLATIPSLRHVDTLLTTSILAGRRDTMTPSGQPEGCRYATLWTAMAAVLT